MLRHGSSDFTPSFVATRVIALHICSYILVKSEITEIWMSGKAAKSEWSAKNPYFTKITDNYVLNGESSRKETRHIVFDLGDSGLEYKAGDALGVVPRCPPS